VSDDEKRMQVPVSWFIAAVSLGLLVVVLAYFIGKGCSPSPQPVDDLGIDAGPGEAEIAARLDGATQHAAEELARIEREHADELAAFDESQREKYETLREEGPEAVSDFLAAFNRRFRDGG